MSFFTKNVSVHLLYTLNLSNINKTIRIVCMFLTVLIKALNKTSYLYCDVIPNQIKMLNSRAVPLAAKLRYCFWVFGTSIRGRVTAVNQTWRLCLQLSLEFEWLLFCSTLSLLCKLRLHYCIKCLLFHYNCWLSTTKAVWPLKVCNFRALLEAGKVNTVNNVRLTKHIKQKWKDYICDCACPL
jgi:hypothetical protein